MQRELKAHLHCVILDAHPGCAPDDSSSMRILGMHPLFTYSHQNCTITESRPGKTGVGEVDEDIDRVTPASFGKLARVTQVAFRMNKHLRKTRVLRRELEYQAAIGFLAEGLKEDLNREIQRTCRRPRRWWVKRWIARRAELGASDTLVQEWARENPEDFRNHFRMSRDQYSFLLERVRPRITKKDTSFREALRAEIKLQITLRYIATGDSFDTLSALYRVAKCTVSKFLPEVCRAIYDALGEYIQVNSVGNRNIFIQDTGDGRRPSKLRVLNRRVFPFVRRHRRRGGGVTTMIQAELE